MTGKIPDATVDPDAELDLPPPPPARITGLLVSLGAAVLGLVAALAIRFLVGDGSPWLALLSALMLGTGPLIAGWLLWRRGVRQRWREVAFRCADELAQSVARVVSITAMALFAAGITVLSVESDHGEIEAAMMVLQGGSLVAWGIMVDLLWRGRPCRLRRMFGIGADTLCVTLLLCVGGPPTQAGCSPISGSVWAAL
jgi:hypothetical protein